MARSRSGLVVAASVVSALSLLLLRSGPASGGKADESQELKEKATAAFALNNYAAAAEYFEKAFELTPEPALLYNAAQAHRLGGNKERALVLYRNHSRLYGKKEKRADVEAHIEELTRAIEQDKAVAASPPLTTAPTGEPPPAPPPIADPAGGPVLLTQPVAPPPEGESVVKKPWFWGVVGGGVAVAVAVTLLLVLSGTDDPRANLGKVDGQ